MLLCQEILVAAAYGDLLWAQQWFQVLNLYHIIYLHHHPKIVTVIPHTHTRTPPFTDEETEAQSG